MVLIPVCLFATYTLGFGNDNFSYGFSDDRDDGCTHAILMKYEDILSEDVEYEVNAQLLSYTVRPMTYMNIRGEMQYLDGRLDELRLTGGLSREIYVGSSRITSRVLVGYSFYGNFGGEFLQNLCHDVLNLRLIELKYSSFIPSSSLLASIDVKTGRKAYSGIHVWVGHEGLMKMGGKVYLGYGEEKTEFKSFVGIEANLNIDNQILSIASMMSTGVMSGFSLDTGFIAIDYKRYNDRNTGYGTIAFSIGNENNWEENDIYVSYGVHSIYGKPMNTIVARKSLGDNIQLVFKDDFTSKVYQNSPVKGLTTLTSLEVGFRGGDAWYAQATIGYGWTMCEDHSVNYFIGNPVVQKEEYLTSSLELGYSWMSLITAGSSNLGIELFCGMHMKGNTNLLRNHTEYTDLNVTDVAPYFGARAVMGIDF